METERQEYKGHRIELRAPEADSSDTDRAGRAAEPELLVDDEPIRYGRLPDGQYFMHEYAYDWRDNLIDLARGLIDYRERVEETRRAGAPEGGE